MQDFKFFDEEKPENILRLNEHAGFLSLYQPQDFSNSEFCFQFGDDEPIVFASGPNDCVINLRPTPGGSMTFRDNSDNNKVFKLFARERLND